MWTFSDRLKVWMKKRDAFTFPVIYSVSRHAKGSHFQHRRDGEKRSFSSVFPLIFAVSGLRARRTWRRTQFAVLFSRLRGLRRKRLPF